MSTPGAVHAGALQPSTATADLICRHFEEAPENLDHYWFEFIPFSCDGSFGVDIDMDRFSSCEVMVDVSCSGSEQFNGTVSSRQYVDMSMASFAALFAESPAAAPVRCLYLSQVALHNCDPTEPPAPLREYFQPPWFPHNLRQKTLSSVHLWANLSAASSSLHYDAYHNILSVLRGRKCVLLVPPGASGGVTLRPAHDSSANHARAPFLAGPAAHEPGCLHTVIEAGQCLFIPEGWWHQVSSDPRTVAVNYWFESPIGSLTKQPHLGAYAVRAAFSSLLCARRAGLMRSTLGEGAAGAVAAAAAREASWTANSLIATVEQRQRWASFSEGMCAELFAALTVLCVHSSEWRKKKTRRCVEFSSKFRAIFCCCSLVEMNRLWTYVARKHSGEWARMMLSLGPDEVHCVCATWEEANHGEDRSVKRRKIDRNHRIEVKLMIENLFAACGSIVAEKIQVHFDRSESLISQYLAMDIISAVLL